MTRCVVVNEFVDKSVQPAARRLIGSTLEVDDAARVERWMDQQLVHVAEALHGRKWPWGVHQGRDLTFHAAMPTVPRVVACLNVWNDRPALEQTVPTWIECVDRVIVVDGAYAGIDAALGASTDGTVEYMRGVVDEAALEVVGPVDGTFWRDQFAKRNTYLDRATAGDLLFVIDADEFVEGAECLHKTHRAYDVGWVRLRARETYRREYDTPRVFRYEAGMKYQGRHHWIEDADGILITSHQYAGIRCDHTVLPITIDHARGLGRTGLRAHAIRGHRHSQTASERAHVKTVSDEHNTAREALRIVHLTQYDPGNVVYRLHSAINATTPHSSIYARVIQKDDENDNNPYDTPYQYDLSKDRDLLRIAVREADVVHCHLGYYGLHTLGVARAGRPLVIHHHGTMYRNAPELRNTQDANEGAGLRLVSNVEMLHYADDLVFLPNPVPATQYKRMREGLDDAGKWPESGSFRVAHAPSKRHLKGTEDFIAVCESLRDAGLPIEPVLIEGVDHETSLEIKATCDACFDSFWLGMQCSGIEAAAMGMPVLAGDERCRDEVNRLFGYVPWTYAPDRDALQYWLRRLMTDPIVYEEEAKRVTDHVRQHHDVAAVTMKYFDLLDERFHWRDRLRIGVYATEGGL